MARREAGRLVEEEQFGVVPRSKDFPPPPLELEDAEQPPPDNEQPADAPLAVVEAAAIARECAAIRCGNQGTEGRDAILVGHGLAHRDQIHRHHDPDEGDRDGHGEAEHRAGRQNVLAAP